MIERIEPSKEAIEAAMAVDADSRSRSLSPENWWAEVLQAAYAIDFAQLQAERDQLLYDLKATEFEMDEAIKERDQIRLVLQEAQALAERLKLEAQIHAQEARTQKSTVHEIYQLVSGGNGEPGDWNGAEPVRKYIAQQQATLQELAEALRLAKRYVDHSSIIEKLDAALAKASPWLRKEGSDDLQERV